MLNRTIDGKAVPEEDVEKAKADLEQMIQTGVYQKYMKFKEYKKVADKIRKAMKDNGSTEELQRKLSEAQEKANEVFKITRKGKLPFLFVHFAIYIQLFVP